MTKSLNSMRAPNGRGYLSQPLVKDIYTADPSAHVFEGKIYVYPSHDIDAGIPDDDLGSQYAMRDYVGLKVMLRSMIETALELAPVAANGAICFGY